MSSSCIVVPWSHNVIRGLGGSELLVIGAKRLMLVGYSLPCSSVLHMHILVVTHFA